MVLPIIVLYLTSKYLDIANTYWQFKHADEHAEGYMQRYIPLKLPVSIGNMSTQDRGHFVVVFKSGHGWYNL